MATYTVLADDTLSKIARDVMGDLARWPELAALNNIAAPYIIFPGQVLQLPGADAREFYKGPVGRGEPLPGPTTTTPESVARGVDVNWPLIALALAGVGLIWFGTKK